MRFELTTLTLARLCSTPELRPHHHESDVHKTDPMERAMRFELTTLTLARLCSTPELRPHSSDCLPLWSGADNSPTKSDCNPFFHEIVTLGILAVFLDFKRLNCRNPSQFTQICVLF